MIAYAAITLAGAYGVYYLANALDWSGIFAALTFSVTLRVLHARRATAARIEFVGRFWDGVATIANAILFFLVGAALSLARLGPALPIAAVTVAAVFASRFAIVYGLLRLARPRLHPAWMTVVRMAGIRGALSLALALAIPLGLPDRSLIIDATFVCVIVTIFVGSLRAFFTQVP